MHLLRALIAGAFIGITAIGGGTIVTAAAVEDEDDGLRAQSHASFVLDPADRKVRVTMDLTLTHERPDEGTRAFFLDEIRVPVPIEATDVAARRVGGGRLQVSLDSTDHPLLSLATVSLSPGLVYGQTQAIRLSYALPDLPPRSDGVTRANDAFASFLVVTAGSPGLTSVEVHIPQDYAVFTNREFMIDVTDGAYVLSASGIEDPAEWSAAFVARNDDLLDERRFSVADHDVVLRYWPGDEEWADFVEHHVTLGIPILEELIERPWPAAGLEIMETSTPHVYGFSGWYDAVANVIEIGDALDAGLLLHELSHAWFNPDFSQEGWLIEGLAQEYGHRAHLEIDPAADGPQEVRPDEVGRHSLRWWPDDFLAPHVTAEDLEFKYRIAWWLTHQLVEDIGLDGMAEVTGAIFDGTIAYRGSPAAEPALERGADWRRILDLLEEVGASQRAAELYVDYVMHLSEAIPIFAERDRARETYSEFLDASGGWSAPLQLRQIMSGWRYREVDALVETATTVLAHRDSMLALIGELGVDELPGLRESYESSEDLSTLVEEAEQHLQVAGAVAEASGQIDGTLPRLGLLGTDTDGMLRDAAAALAAGDPAKAEELVELVRQHVGDAPVVGGILTAQLFVCLGAVAWRRRSVRTSAFLVL